MAPSLLIDECMLNGGGAAKQTDASYLVNDVPLGTRRSLRIVTIGAGASGLNLARHVGLHMDNVDHVIYEKNADVGGTWFENRYANFLESFAVADLIGDTLAARVTFPVTTTSSPGRPMQNGPDCERSQNMMRCMS
jgi:hypothetical protein